MQRIIVKISVAILIIALADLVYVNYWIIKGAKTESQNQVSNKSKSENPEVSPFLITATPSPSAETKTVETKSAVEKETQTIIQTSQKEIFIPIGSGSTKSNSFEDLAGLEVAIDTNKYSAIDSVVFEASIWVEGGNGKVYTQLYNSSDKRPVWFSEISTNSAKGILTTSGKITLEKGVRTYRVQAKTDMNAYAAHVDNARIKITLK